MTWVSIRSGLALWTVGHHRDDGRWEPESDHPSPEAAADRAAHLNGAGS